jgi:hypothetical protein
MEWLLSLALLPLLLCGAMCVGGMLLAFFGIRRASQPSCHTPTRADDRAQTPEDSLERL